MKKKSHFDKDQFLIFQSKRGHKKIPTKLERNRESNIKIIVMERVYRRERMSCVFG